MNAKISLILILLLVILPSFACSEDGAYDATVTTDSGSYSVPVEVEDGEVAQVHWSNGGDMTVYGAEISDGEASGTNSRGDSVSIELEDYDDESEELEE